MAIPNLWVQGLILPQTKPNIFAIYHYNDVIMSAMASQITSLTIIYSTVYSGTDERKHQSSVSLAFVRGIHRWPVNSPHKGPVTRKMFPFDDVIMRCALQPAHQWHGCWCPGVMQGARASSTMILICRCLNIVSAMLNLMKSHFIWWDVYLPEMAVGSCCRSLTPTRCHCWCSLQGWVISYTRVCNNKQRSLTTWRLSLTSWSSTTR